MYTARKPIEAMCFIMLIAAILSGETAVAEPECKPTVVGNLRVEHFQSKIFDRTITVRIWLPAGYDDATEAARKYPTLYMLDGQNAFDQCTTFKGERELQMDETVTRLIAERNLAPMIVVGVDSAHG